MKNSGLSLLYKLVNVSQSTVHQKFHTKGILKARKVFVIFKNSDSQGSTEDHHLRIGCINTSFEEGLKPDLVDDTSSGYYTPAGYYNWILESTTTNHYV